MFSYSKSFRPKINASNAVLIYTGNPRLTTSASLLKASSTPKSLEADKIRQGRKGLFTGDSEAKTFWYLTGPLSLGFFLLSVWGVASNILLWPNSLVKSRFLDSFSRDWVNEKITLNRLCKHSTTLLPYTALTGLGLMIMYLVKQVGTCGSDLTLLSLWQSMHPWKPFTTHEMPEQWMFLLACLVLYKATIGFVTSIKNDKHSKRARRVYKGLLLIADLQKRACGSLEAIERWKSKSVQLKRKERGWALRGFSLFLHAVCAIFFSLPVVVHTVRLHIVT